MTKTGAKSKGKQLIGIVTSNKMDKTIVVKVERVTKHPLYGKRISKHKKFMAHDENNECSIGDKVLISESRPLSRRKRWELVKILERKLI
jgi:small subunit ribosomal protein S17